MKEKPKDNDRYGQDLLLINEVFSLPEKERKSYLKNMKAKELSRLIQHSFLGNLNSNVKRQVELEK
jgi:hypothetical protein